MVLGPDAIRRLHAKFERAEELEFDNENEEVYREHKRRANGLAEDRSYIHEKDQRSNISLPEFLGRAKVERRNEE